MDSAEMFDNGKAQIALGNTLRELKVRREEVVISTTIFFETFFPPFPPNTIGLSRKKVIEATKSSLKRLQLEYLDLVIAGRPDLDTPLEETCRAFSWLVDQGLTFYWGTSEWAATLVTDAIDICHKLGLHAPVTDQIQYNMLTRNVFERDYRHLYERFNYGTTTWSPLAGGLLTGKYNDGVAPEDSTRGNSALYTVRANKFYFSEEKTERTLKTLRALGGLAKELGYT